MTNLSKELCEICGIKPYYKCKNVPCLNFIFDTGICNITESVCNPYECKNDYEPDTTHRSWKDGQAVYPDFEQPENFVKLFNLQYNQTTLAASITSDNSILNTKDFIFHVIEELKNIYFDTSEIKQAIRETEWVYG